MRSDISIFVKSYSKDFVSLGRLLRSIEMHNAEGLPVTLCVPGEELAQARRRFSTGYTTLVADEDLYTGRIPTNWAGFTRGYLSQQLVKLSVHRLDLSKWYWVLDSDTTFIRDFTSGSLRSRDGVYYTFCSEDRELLVAPWYRTYSDSRWVLQRVIADRIGLTGEILSAHNNLIMSAGVLAELEEWASSELSGLSSLLELAPYEFGWYVMFLRRFFPGAFSAAEPLIRMVHTRSEYRSLRYQGVTLDDLRRGYLGVCLNSSWSDNDSRDFMLLHSRSWSAALRLRLFGS
jgi:hypothetical protein